ncbi:membrane-associated guanylate kinase, WW and PDZ domain-containing protein 1-like isoform X2 [Petromyzon marinus]|uniref:membrane-associated guanylate kinase, WW and PDZ domain-containing protein 1-like isoform X2 n=1 Tax=Petromyzon marinus TaxID=7757 RepID=UPI003F6EBAB2
MDINSAGMSRIDVQENSKPTVNCNGNTAGMQDYMHPSSLQCRLVQQQQQQHHHHQHSLPDIPASPPEDVDSSPGPASQDFGGMPTGLPHFPDYSAVMSADSFLRNHNPKDPVSLEQQIAGSLKPREELEDDELPFGWEKVDDPEYGVYYVDHINRKTQFENPVAEEKNTKLQQLQDSVSKALNSYTPEAYPSFECQAEGYLLHNSFPCGGAHQQAESKPRPSGKAFFTRNPAELQGTFVSTSLLKSGRGFGFTIIGGDEPDEFLQVKSLVPDGPAAVDSKIETGDVIVSVNSTCVLGYTHAEVVKIFQAIPIGQQVGLQLCRGYPLPFDPDDPSTTLVTSVAICDKEPVVLEGKGTGSVVCGGGGGGGGGGLGLTDGANNGNHHASQTSTSGVSSQDSTRDNCSLTLGPLDGMLGQSAASLGAVPGAQGQLQGPLLHSDNVSLASSIATQPELMTVHIVKGLLGFGFTITDTPAGQRVKQILDGPRCRGLREGDIIAEINKQNVRPLSHTHVVELLKECPTGSETIVTIHREGYYSPRTSNQVPERQKNPSCPQYGLPPLRIAPPTVPPMAPPLGLVKPPASPSHSDGQERRGALDPQHYEEAAAVTYDFRSPEYEEMDVLLQRQESGFGFRILGGDDPGEPIYIGAIVPLGAADTDGRLRPGDELVSVDGTIVAGKSHRHVIALMQHAARNGHVQLMVRRPVIPTIGGEAHGGFCSSSSSASQHNSPRIEQAAAFMRKLKFGGGGGGGGSGGSIGGPPPLCAAPPPLPPLPPALPPPPLPVLDPYLRRAFGAGMASASSALPLLSSGAPGSAPCLSTSSGRGGNGGNGGGGGVGGDGVGCFPETFAPLAARLAYDGCGAARAAGVNPASEPCLLHPSMQEFERGGRAVAGAAPEGAPGGAGDGARTLPEAGAGNGEARASVATAAAVAAAAVISTEGFPSSVGRLTYDVTIQRNDNEGFGFVIVSSLSRPEAGTIVGMPHLVGRIIAASPADRCGRLRVGDRILSVNGQPIQGLSHADIINLIKDSGTSVTLCISSPDESQKLPSLVNAEKNATVAPNNQTTAQEGSLFDRFEVRGRQDIKPDMNPGQEAEYYSVDLEKGLKGFGFSLRGGHEYNMDLFILRLAEDGPAIRTGKLRVGDQIIEIDGESTKDMTHARAIELIKNSSGRVHLFLKRGTGLVPDYDGDVWRSPTTGAPYASVPEVNSAMR